jgi:hypothetical protein
LYLRGVLTVNDQALRRIILDTASDLAKDFAYYDRKEDEDLRRGAIEQALADGMVSLDDILIAFRTELISELDLDAPSTSPPSTSTSDGSPESTESTTEKLD